MRYDYWLNWNRWASVLNLNKPDLRQDSHLAACKKFIAINCHEEYDLNQLTRMAEEWERCFSANREYNIQLPAISADLAITVFYCFSAEGILSKLIDSVKTAHANGEFSIPASHQKAIRTIRAIADSSTSIKTEPATASLIMLKKTCRHLGGANALTISTAYQNGLISDTLNEAKKLCFPPFYAKFEGDVIDTLSGFIKNACISYRHDFGLMNEEEQLKLKLDAVHWYWAFNTTRKSAIVTLPEEVSISRRISLAFCAPASTPASPVTSATL